MTLDTDKFTDLEIFAKTLDGEAGNQGYLGKQAVANVIMYRTAHRWKHETTVRGTCLHPAQFSCWLPCPDRTRIMTAPFDPECMEIAKLAMAGKLPDISGGADSYVVRGTKAYWTRNLNPVASIGAHDFYRTV